MNKLFAFAVAVAVAATATAQPSGTSLYGEVLGTTGRYALGVEQVVHRVGSSSVALRLGASYTDEKVFDTDFRNQVFAVPVGAMMQIPLGGVTGIPFSLEAEGGVVFATWRGPVNRFETSPGQRLDVFPQASGYLRADVLGPVYVRAGITLAGLRPRSDYAPSFGVGVGL